MEFHPCVALRLPLTHHLDVRPALDHCADRLASARRVRVVRLQPTLAQPLAQGRPLGRRARVDGRLIRDDRLIRESKRRAWNWVEQ